MTANTEIKKSKRTGIKRVAGKAIKELERIAFSEDEPIKIRMDILKWFAEHEVGKPKGALPDTETDEDKTFDIRVCIED